MYDNVESFSRRLRAAAFHHVRGGINALNVDPLSEQLQERTIISTSEFQHRLPDSSNERQVRIGLEGS